MFAFLMGLTSVAPEKLAQELSAGQVTVVDMNSRASWLRARVPGAIHLGDAEFGGDQLPAGPRGGIVFYCSNPYCRKAPNAARRAKRLGYIDVRVMSAGIQGWMAAGLPFDSGES